MKFAIRSNLDESRLILEASTGDLDAFNQLVLIYQDLVFSQAFALLGDIHSAEDAAQECFLKAFKNIHRFRDVSFQAWLHRIVVNTCYNEMRWFRRHPTTPLIPEDGDNEDLESSTWLMDPNFSVQVIVEREDLSRTLYHMLDELPEIYRNPITLVDLYELDYSEAAGVLAIPLGTLKSRLARARFQIREQLRYTFEFSGGFRPTDAKLVAL